MQRISRTGLALESHESCYTRGLILLQGARTPIYPVELMSRPWFAKGGLHVIREAEQDGFRRLTAAFVSTSS
jgi:hypothetical protein